MEAYVCRNAKVGAGLGSGSLEEGLECPVCWESFDDGDSTPYILWCGHSLCKSCVLSLGWATMKFFGLPLHLPLFICCPWCQFLTPRFKWKGQLRYPCKNFFLLWVVESLQGERGRPRIFSEDNESSPSFGLVTIIFPRARLQGDVVGQRHPGSIGRQYAVLAGNERWSLMRCQRSAARMLASFLQFTARIPLVLLLLFIVVYVLPFSTLVLALYCVITVLLAVPSFMVLYFAYPSIDWLVRAIAS